MGYRMRRQPNALPSNWSSPEKAPKARRPTKSALRPMFSQKSRRPCVALSCDRRSAYRCRGLVFGDGGDPAVSPVAVLAR